MAETVHLYLKANGTDIAGESTQTSLGRENSIECVEFQDSVRTAREHGSRAAVGRRVHAPIRIVKRIDKSSPLIAKALCRNERVDAEFKFFRPNPNGDGTTEQFFTVKLENGRVDSIERGQQIVAGLAGADSVRVTVLRGGKPTDVTVSLR